MKTINFSKHKLIACILLYGLPHSAYAYNCDNWVAKLQSAQGSVQIRQSEKNTTTKSWLTVKRNDTFCKGDVLRVQENSRAALLLRNETIVRLDQNTTITFTSLTPDKPSVVSLETGVAHFISRVKAAFEVITPFINAAIEGTEFVVSAKQSVGEVTVFEGAVRAYNQHGEVRLTTNQTVQAKQGQAPVLVIRVKPRDAVNWSLYYPAVFDPNDLTTTGRESLQLKASNALATGQVEQAANYLQQVLDKNLRNVQALAMQAIISIVQNDKDKGLKLAQQAVAADEKNATAKLALSYAQQAHFNINAALSTLEQAVKDTPNNAMVWSRLAEVYLMHGELDKALSAAKKANELNPKLGRTHTVLGFAYLTRIEIAQAIETFNKAIDIDQADPLARLGLGLATIRQGNLKKGRREIEYAATLDPNNALIRSYLGKAYYEEKRNDLAATQFEMAKTLDPNDPTAYFYDAIRMQSENKNIQALNEMQQAIQKNNNRAVFSSNLKLEQDNAAKGVSQAQIYNSVGFNIEAQNLAYQSLQTDHGNHMAHRFLAEAYANRPRHEIARVSEALQALLYAPLSHNPVPPHISETNLGTLPDAGPSSNSFNTYNSLFERDGNSWSINAIVGDQQTAGDEVVYSVLENNIAMSLGQYHYQNEGFRPNNDYQQDIVNFFFQSAINPNHSIQFEFKRNETEVGDLRLRFDPNNYNINRRETDKTDSFRVGYNWKLNNHSNWVSSLSVISRDFTREDHSVLAAGAGPGGADVILEDDLDDHHSGHIFETQYLYKNNWLTSLMGAGNYDLTVTSDEIFQLTANDAILTGGTTRSTTQQTQSNIYLYNYINIKNINIIFGFSNDDSNSDYIYGSANKLNHKLGILFDATKDVKIRAAAFSTLTRSLTTSQTIEPTQIAGFNQFYEDQLATTADNLALGIDYRTKSNSAGIELIKRNLIIPGNDSGNRIEDGQKELVYRAYLHFLLNNNISTGIEWLYEEFDKELTSRLPSNQPKNLMTHKIPLFVSTSILNFSARLSMTYYDQDVITPDASQNLSTQRDSFWIGNLQLSHKLSKRNGEIRLTVNNLFDQKFGYYDSTFRTVTARAPAVSHNRNYSLSINLPFN